MRYRQVITHIAVMLGAFALVFLLAVSLHGFPPEWPFHAHKMVNVRFES